MMDVDKYSVKLRLVEETDADFILSLRLDARYNEFLSKVDPDLQSQIVWIRGYKNDELAGNQYYFIIEKNDGTPCGTVRIYDIREDSFCWGSWILNSEKTRLAAIESSFLVYDFGFNHLGFKKSHFDVMKKNERVIKFHTRMGAAQVDEDDNNIYFHISKEAVSDSRLSFEGLRK